MQKWKKAFIIDSNFLNKEKWNLGCLWITNSLEKDSFLKRTDENSIFFIKSKNEQSCVFVKIYTSVNDK